MDNDDIVTITGADDNMSYSSGQTLYSSTYTIDTSTWANSSITGIGSLPSSAVHIDTTGIKMNPDTDLKIGNRSLKTFMDKVEERLNILHVNEQLEERWEQLAELGKQYRELEKDLLEKEKMWKILKDTK